MGFSTLLDILGSTLIGGLLLLILFRLNDTATENTFTYTGDLIVQESLVEAVTLLEYDFRKIGYCENWSNIDPLASSILLADSNKISFLTDVSTGRNLLTGLPKPGDGIVDTLHYYLGLTSELSSTDNPNDCILYRVKNSDYPRGSNIGVTKFKLSYFDSFGEEILPPINESSAGTIQSMQIDIEIQNIYSYDNNYSSIFWRQIRLASKNLRNR